MSSCMLGDEQQCLPNGANNDSEHRCCGHKEPLLTYAHSMAVSCHLYFTVITEDHSVQCHQQMILQMLETAVAITDLLSKSGQSGCFRSALLTWYASEAAVAAASSLALGTRGPSRCMTTALAMAPMTDLQLAPTRRFDTSVRTRNFVSCSLQCKEGCWGVHIHSLPCSWQERLGGTPVQ